MSSARGRLDIAFKPWLLAAVLVLAAGLLAYRNSFTGPFIFDDVETIQENSTIRHLWPIWNPLSPPHGRGMPVQGRPVLNLSLAVNYAFGGTKVWGYHALNLAIHILAALTLFGIVRRTLLQPPIRGTFAEAATPLALAMALIWMLHPLQTEAVTYVVQRAESLMGLFYLLTLYCFIRSADSQTPGRWYALSVAACLLGMATKEVMVSAPLIVLLYDWAFIAGSVRDAWQRRWRLYAGLAATWLVLVYLVVAAGNRGGSAGFGSEVVWWEYALTQCPAIVHYLKLSVWPHPLIFYYGAELVKSAAEAAPYALILTALAAATVIGLWRQRAIGFLGVWFFAILAPSSSVVPVVTQTMAEHRMYLPLATVVVLAVLGIHALIGRRSMVVFLALAVGLGFMTSRRNEDYRSGIAIWSDTVAKRPTNPGAHNNLGIELQKSGKLSEAKDQYEQALRIKPDHAEAHNNLGSILLDLGEAKEALNHIEQAARLEPTNPRYHKNLGVALLRSGRVTESIEQFEQALRLDPDYARAHDGLGNALLRLGKVAEAITQYEQALHLEPDYAEAHHDLGVALERAGKPQEATGHLEQAVRLNPDAATYHRDLGYHLLRQGRFEQAAAQYQQALQIEPDNAGALGNLGYALAKLGRVAEAIAQYQRALQLDPDNADIHYDLGNALIRVGKFSQAVEQYEQALQINPTNAGAHYNLGDALVRQGKAVEALPHYLQASQIAPDNAAFHSKLGAVLMFAGKPQEAIPHLEQALRMKPDFAETQNKLAWLLATLPPADGGDPARAVSLAQRACELTGNRAAGDLDTLAVAYAAAGRFDDAVTTAQKAIDLARSAGQPKLVEEIEARLQLYRNGRAYRPVATVTGPANQ